MVDVVGGKEHIGHLKVALVPDLLRLRTAHQRRTLCASAMAPPSWVVSRYHASEGHVPLSGSAATLNDCSARIPQLRPCRRFECRQAPGDCTVEEECKRRFPVLHPLSWHCKAAFLSLAKLSTQTAGLHERHRRAPSSRPGWVRGDQERASYRNQPAGRTRCAFVLCCTCSPQCS